MTDAPAPAPEDWPLVSVIMPTRGRPELVRESIAAVVAQNYPGPIECLVVHDQEPPDTELAAPGHAAAPGQGGREHPHTRPGGRPQHRSRRRARRHHRDLRRRRPLASRSSWPPGRADCSDDPDLLVVGSGIRLLLPGTGSSSGPGGPSASASRLLLRNRVKELHSSTLVMRRDAFAKAGTYDEKLPHGYAEDYDWVLRAARVGRIGIVSSPLADIRKDVQSWFRGAVPRTPPWRWSTCSSSTRSIKTSRRGHARMLGQIAFARSTLGERRPAIALRGRRRPCGGPISPHAYLALVQATTGAFDPQASAACGPALPPRHVVRRAMPDPTAELPSPGTEQGGLHLAARGALAPSRGLPQRGQGSLLLRPLLRPRSRVVRGRSSAARRPEHTVIGEVCPDYLSCAEAPGADPRPASARTSG